MSERIRLTTKHQPSKEELLQAAAEKPVRRVLTVDVHGLDEDGPVFDGYPDSELRNSDIPIRVQVADGTSRGELLFYLRKLLEEIRNDDGWSYLTFGLPRLTTLDTGAGAQSGKDHGGTA